MSDIRRIDLNTRANTEEQKVTVTPKEEFLLGADRHAAVLEKLPDLMNYPYWSPVYQAYEPFMMAYFCSGAVPNEAAIWLPKLGDKLEELQPRKARHHNIMVEVQNFYKSSGTNCFDGYTWGQIQEFIDEIPMYIDNRKLFYEYIYDAKQYESILTTLLEGGIYTTLDSKYRSLCGIPYAIYLYRHCMIDSFTLSDSLRQMFMLLIEAYIKKFDEIFASISEFIGEDVDVYKWYRPQVQKIIDNAWRTSLDLSSKRSVITSKDVFSMEVWLSEQLTDYVGSLPCTYTTRPDNVFIMDALDAVLTNDRGATDISFMYAYCIPKSYLKSFMDRLSEFYWDVKEGHFVELLRSINKSEYARDTTGTARSPEEYDFDLAMRGFPLE